MVSKAKKADKIEVKEVADEAEVVKVSKEQPINAKNTSEAKHDTNSNEDRETTLSEISDEENSEAEKISEIEEDDGTVAVTSKELEDTVDEIVESESDELLKNEDAKLAAAYSPTTTLWGKVKGWFGVRRNQYIAMLVGVLIVAVILFVPAIKFAVLNSIGVRSSLQITVLDGGSGLPLKNVDITVAARQTKTDKRGEARITGLRLGSAVLSIEKLAYDSSEMKIIINSGTNSLSPVSLTPVGMQFTLNLTSWLSGTKLPLGEVSSGQNSVFSNDNGVAVLTIPPTEDDEIVALATVDGYREEEIFLKPDMTTPQNVAMVLDKPNYFFSKKSGNYDLQRVDLDGKNVEVVVTGTGKENDNIQLLEMIDRDEVYFVSSREGKSNNNGSIKYGLFKLDTKSDEFERIDESESIRLYGESENKLIYLKISAGASESNQTRQRLVSYDPISEVSIEIDASNNFNSIIITDHTVFYALSDFFDTEQTPFLFRANPQTGVKTTVHPAEVWTIYRTGFKELTYDAQQDWYKTSTTIGAIPAPLDGRPSNISTRLYRTNLSESKSVWVDIRDGKGHLIVYNVDTEEENSIYNQAGIKHPIKWVDDDHIVFRVVTDDESADYIIDLRGSEAAKITDVSDVDSYDRWYYYY